MTAVTEALVDAKDDTTKAELRGEITQAVSDILIALERQSAEHAATLERHAAEHNAARERQTADFRVALERQATESERQATEFERRLSAATYWLFGAIVAGHVATVGVVAILINNNL